MIFKFIKKLLNDLDYKKWNSFIMSDAMEYQIDPDVLEAQLKANYENHYDKGVNADADSDCMD